MHYFSNLFWYRTLIFSDRFTVHHQESSTVHTAICICHTGYADCLLASSQHNLCTRLLMMDSKPVRKCRILYQNKFENSGSRWFL